MLIARSVHPLPGEAERKERLLSLIDGFASRRVLVVGDLIADEFIYGEVARVSREAPVLILKYDATETVAGGAGNAANNLAALGGRVALAGLVGTDAEGRRLLGSFHRGVDRRRHRACRRLSHAGQDAHPRRRRALGEAAGRPHRPRSGLAAGGRRRPDVRRGSWGRRSPTATRSSSPTTDRDSSRPPWRRPSVPALSTRARRRPVPVLLDSRYRLLDYRALTICTPNESEVEQALDLRIDDDPGALERAGRAILKRTRMQGVLITRGSRGMALFEHKQPTVHVPIFGSDEIADVTGAGDTVIATCALALAAGASFYEAALLGELRRRGRRDEARHGDRQRARAHRRRRERSRHVARELVPGRAGTGAEEISNLQV